MVVSDARTDPRVIWHDLECGAYRADLALWRDLAGARPGPVLDIGAGTGRVALTLAPAREVTAVDSDPVLLSALEERSRDLPVHTVCADVRAFDLGRRFGLCMVPMQTVQLLGGPAGRDAFLACARRHLLPGGLLAMAIVEDLVAFGAEEGHILAPDLRELDGTVYSSRPVAVRVEGERSCLERLRETVDPHGHRRVEVDLISLDRLGARELRAEGAGHGLQALPSRTIAPTADHVGSEVVILRA